MENTNRPVQRVFPIRSDSNINCQTSCNLTDTSCSSSNPQQYKLLTSANGVNCNNLASVNQSVPFVQQNVNIMNINIPNNALLQGVSQDSNNSFSQMTASPKTFLQLADGRYVQIAQNVQQIQNQLPTTFLVQMPYKLVDPNSVSANQALINKRFSLPSKVDDKALQQNNTRFITLGGAVNTMLLPNQSTDFHTPALSQNDFYQLSDNKEYQNNDSKLGQNVNVNGNIISLDKVADNCVNWRFVVIPEFQYQEICDMLQNKKLLAKAGFNEETVLVEFRLNQQKYQLRMTRNQKVDMEKLLISAGNQQRQMEILQVYQSEQRKNMQQRTPVILNQLINKNSSNIVCNSPQLQALNITKPIYPLNSVLVAVSQNQYNDTSMVQPISSISQTKTVPVQSTVSLQNPNGIALNSRLPVAQSSILSVPTIPREPIKEISKPKRVSKAPVNCSANIPNLTSNQEMKPARSRRYNNMRKTLFDDQNSVITPNCQHTFEDLNDVARRLLPYHILDECKDQKFDDVDKILSNTFMEINKRCTNLKRIASSLTMNDMIMEKDSEQLLIKRMQLDLEQDLFEREKAPLKEERIDCVDQEQDNDNVILIEDDSPTPIKCEPGGGGFDENDDNVADTDPLNEPMSFVDCIDNDNTCDTMLDSLYNYDIQDISNDSIDWDKEVTKCSSPIIEQVTDNEDNQQSADPDLDAAIKSILF